MVTDAEGKNRIIITNYLSDIIKTQRQRNITVYLFF